jgi:hypothetical protein
MMMDAFGWTPEQFWEATPHEVWACIDAREETTKTLRR